MSDDKPKYDPAAYTRALSAMKKKLLQGGDINMPVHLELLPGNVWQPCLCREIHPEDQPCLICEAWIHFDRIPPSGVNALYTIQQFRKKEGHDKSKD